MNENAISLESMFLGADPAVQAVMLLLLAASVLTWAVILEKIFLLGRSSRAAGNFRKMAGGRISEKELKKLPRPFQAVVSAGFQAGRKCLKSESPAEFKARAEGVMRLALADYLDRLSRRTLFLASVGSISPFVGLFGTVWGIMHSFVGIAGTGETTLAVVAPGIAEALLATAMGLAAAIPAVLGYNAAVGSLKQITRRSLGAVSLLAGTLAGYHFSPEEDGRTEDGPGAV
ncbi:MAG: MotA/TolQ/ExbB proton channel family protein [Deltaproteobacteria bacterium]|jgi:biopolymer transport protein ExbB/TolQ|nr:MotA/TolQ/ExbB proton channel family protein [Deltaproteobacteria bacterium]